MVSTDQKLKDGDQTQNSKHRHDLLNWKIYDEGIEMVLYKIHMQSTYNNITVHVEIIHKGHNIDGLNVFVALKIAFSKSHPDLNTNNELKQTHIWYCFLVINYIKY